MPLLHHVNQALRAHTLFRLDVDYMIKDGEVVIVDEFTGRLMPGRRWSDGLHQAVEAKEKVKIERENQTLATVTFQNYFRKYKKLAGMTGTADTEAAEFAKIYNLDVVVIPPNRPLLPRRESRPRLSHRDGKVGRDRQRHPRGARRRAGRCWSAPCRSRNPRSCRPCSIAAGLKRGTATGGDIDKHVVLNAKYHAQEAEIVAQAGRKGAVVIATNMAGRGTDILLGGNPEFMARQQALAEADRRAPAEGRGAVRRGRCSTSTSITSTASTACPREPYHRVFEHFKKLDRSASTNRSSRSAASTSSAPSATKRGASTTSCAAARAARAIPARRASTCRSKTT